MRHTDTQSNRNDNKLVNVIKCVRTLFFLGADRSPSAQGGSPAQCGKSNILLLILSEAFVLGEAQGYSSTRATRPVLTVLCKYKS